MIVIDASSLAKYILKEENWTDIEEYLVKGLYSVDHIIKEVANSIWKHRIIFKRFTIENCKDAYQVLNRLIKEEVILIEDQSKYLENSV